VLHPPEHADGDRGGEMSALLRTLLVIGVATLATAAGAQVLKPLNQQEAMRTCSPSITDECVVRYFKDTQEASVIRGKAVFQNYCILCHGPEGKGDGRAAKLHTPRPFNLTMSAAPRDYIAQVLRKGGEAMGRGKGMPPWGEQLTDEQINDTLNFLYTIRVNK
jgi:cytochrome c553